MDSFMVMKDDYPRWVCDPCAKHAGGQIPSGHISCWHNDICDSCNQWGPVTQPRDYSYPKLKVKCDFKIIICSLLGAFHYYIGMKMFNDALHISEKIDMLVAGVFEGEDPEDKIVRKTLEDYETIKKYAQEMVYGTAAVISTEPDGEARKGSSDAERAIGTCPQGPIC